MVLSGEGADELFGGYTIYKEPLSLAPFEKVPGALRGLLGEASRHLPEGMRGKDLLRRGALPLEQRYYGNARIFRDDQLRGVLRRYDPRRGHIDITAAHYAESGEWDPVARMQHVDLFTWLRGDILVKADKMTMANSLELRVPFLDPEVFAVRVDAAAVGEGGGGDDEAGAAPRARRHRSRRTCCTGASWASRCRSGTGCATRCTSGRAASSATRRPTTSSTSPPCSA